ncbi:winged helix DNA-binding domain-containing protein [Flagelloscypha sp. PMI_526]|nr:winged helix DNA-binding domain-containing protein [Flagelloscypha sp. PMI_526]
MHRLGGVGIAAFERQEQSKRSFAALSSALSQSHVDHLHSQLDHFRKALAGFAQTHRDKIRKDPEFRHAFQKMCASIGVDPLAGPRKGGWWAEMLGLGDWQHELGVQIVDICVSTRDINGGMVQMDHLLALLAKLRGLDKAEITENDVARSIKSLEALGAGYRIVDVNGSKIVQSVVKEFDDDQTVIMSIAQETGGRVVPAMLVNDKGWTRARALAALENMHLRDGLCWIDDQDEQCGTAYWVICIMKWED